MPLLDLTRQIKNTGNVVLEGVGYASGGSSGNAMNWIYDADMSGTQSNDFTASNTTRVQINATGHGLKDLWLDDEVIKIDLSGGSYNDFNASAGPFAVFDITDSAIILADTNDSVDNRGTTLPGGVTKVDWSANYSDEGNNQPWKYDRDASRLEITRNGSTMFYVDSLQGRAYIGGSLDIGGSTAIIDAGEVQLEDAVLDLNFASGVEQVFNVGEEAGFRIGDTGNIGSNAPTWVFNKAADTKADAYWQASFKGATSNLRVRDITASGISADGILSANSADISGALGVDGDFDVATDKFTVASATGNTSAAGTLGVTGKVTAAGAMDIGAVGSSTGVAIDAVGNMDVDVGFTLAGSTKQTAVQEITANSTLTNNNTSLVTAGSVVHHVDEAMKKVVSYVNGLNHHAHKTINAANGNAQVVMWSGIRGADNFTTGGTNGTMDPNEYTLTINGLNIEPAAVTGLVDEVADSVGYINATFNTDQLDFEIHTDDEVILHGPTKQVP